jgi:hypothetical protein
VWQEKLANI